MTRTELEEERSLNLTDSLPSLTSTEITNCSLPNWYQQFRRETILSNWVVMEELEVVKYLRGEGGSSGMVVPEWLYKVGGGVPESQLSEPEEEEEEEDKEPIMDSRTMKLFQSLDQAGDSSDSDTESERSTLDEDLLFLKPLQVQVQTLIDELGGEVFPKLNWSAPKDATWIAPTKSLRCRDLGEILLLLKSSDDIAHDLHRAYLGCSDPPSPLPPPCLVLRQWCRVDPSREFRCFVLHRRLVGVSQRDTHFYEFLAADLTWLPPLVSQFLESKILDTFSNPHFAVDIYVTSNRSVKIIDFNPASPVTHPLLFDWSELTDLARTPSDLPPWRLIQSTAHGQNAHSHRLTSNHVPTDFIRPTTEARTVIHHISALP